MKCLAMLICVPIHLLFFGLVASYLWLWFAVPLGAPPIGVIHAAGLGLLADVAHSHKWPTEEEKWYLNLSAEFLVISVSFAIGFVVHFFI